MCQDASLVDIHVGILDRDMGRLGIGRAGVAVSANGRERSPRDKTDGLGARVGARCCYIVYGCRIRFMARGSDGVAVSVRT
jgi:hypothetical protein